jgi:hypothetical protein
MIAKRCDVKIARSVARENSCQALQHPHRISLGELGATVHSVSSEAASLKMRARGKPVSKDVSTTMIYTHVMNKGGKGVRSPMDVL